MTQHPQEAPVQTYLDIKQKIETGEGDYPLMELTRDFARLMLSCEALIRQNSALSDKILSTTALMDDQTVQIFAKDLEIHELRAQIAQNPKND
jgi:hypothetical protein